jgi:hypothetical protein
VYLHNRTPNYGNNSTRWESPYTRFHQAIDHARGLPNTKDTKKHPDQTHLVAYGCKAYAMTADAQLKRKRLWKLAPKAWISYMVGYRSSNNYRIWLPTENKIVTMRNVLFNEDEFCTGDLNLFKDELLTINTEALSEYVKQHALPDAEEHADTISEELIAAE